MSGSSTHFEDTRSAERLEVLRGIVRDLRVRAARSEELEAEIALLKRELAAGNVHDFVQREIDSKTRPLTTDRERFRTERNRLVDLILSYASPGQSENLDPDERYHEACEIVSELATVWAELEGIIRESLRAND